MKYKLRKDLSIKFCSKTLYRIERLSNGKLGGYVESEANLSQYDSCWISDEAKVYGDAQVSDNARVFGNAIVCEGALIYDNAQVYGDAKVYGDAWVFGDARIFGNVKVFGNAGVFGNAEIYGNAIIKDKNSIFHCIISHEFPITVTPQNIVIGCQLKKRSEWLKVTIDEAEKLGLPRELYPHYRSIVKAGMKLVPKAKKEK